MDGPAAAADFKRRIDAIASRLRCHPMVALALVRLRPGLLAPVAMRDQVRISWRPVTPRRAQPVVPCCPACLEPTRGAVTVTFVPCDHAMHARCAAAMVTSYIEQGKPLPFACPFPRCRGVLCAVAHIERVAWDLPRQYAPCPDCGRFSFSHQTAAAVQCLACGTRFCHACRRAPHAPSLPCAKVIQHAALVERMQDAMVALDAVPMDELAAAMAQQYASITEHGGVPAWAVVERQVKLHPELLRELASPVWITRSGLPAVEGMAGGGLPPPRQLLNAFSAAEIVVMARRELATATPITVGFPAQKNVLDATVARLCEGVVDAQEPQDALDAQLQQFDAKFCPRCFVRVVRAGGCPSMKCPMRGCGFAFCYECLGPQHTHGRCTRQVDSVQLVAAASAAGVAHAGDVVARLALVLDEDDHFAAIASRQPWQGVGRLDLASLRNQRTARMLPLTVAVERYEALTGDGVTAPDDTLKTAWWAIERALERELALQRQLVPQVREHNQLARNDVSKLAGASDILRFARRRVDVAKERVRLALAPGGVASAMAWAVQARAALATARAVASAVAPDDWLMRGCPRYGGIALDGVALGGVTVVIDPTYLDVCPVSQPGQFSAPTLVRVGDAIRALLVRVLDAADQAVLVAEMSPSLAAHRWSWRPRGEHFALGDVVVRGPNWAEGDMDGGAGCRGVIVFAHDDDDHVRVRWFAHWRGSSYYHANTTVVRAPNPIAAWRDVRALLFDLVPHFASLAHARALACLDACLDAALVIRPLPPGQTQAEEVCQRMNADAERRARRVRREQRRDEEDEDEEDDDDTDDDTDDDEPVAPTIPPVPMVTNDACRPAPAASFVRALEAVRRTYVPPPAWTCVRCTLLNRAEDGQCAACDGARLADPAVSPQAHASVVPGDAALERLLRCMP